ncbi:MAG: hypothetical protein H0U19_12060 [Acidobacteria bacterium]|nr:hypothetical protein [Acidobacteriota bacterium]
MRTRVWRAAIAGIVAGIVMAAFMMLYMAVWGDSVWTNPNLIAVMWLGSQVADGQFGWATLIGFTTHMGASALMGMIGLVLILDLPPRRVMTASVTYALASYPVAIAFIMAWANPLFVARTQVLPMTVAHGVFGLTYGAVFLALNRVGASPPDGFNADGRQDFAPAPHCDEGQAVRRSRGNAL